MQYDNHISLSEVYAFEVILFKAIPLPVVFVLFVSHIVLINRLGSLFLLFVFNPILSFLREGRMNKTRHMHVT